MSVFRRRRRLDNQKPAAAPAAAPIQEGDLVHALRLEVKRVITEASPTAYPAVAARLRDVEGYRQVEDAIIQYVLHNQVTPSAALAQLDSTWGDI